MRMDEIEQMVQDSSFHVLQKSSNEPPQDFHGGRISNFEPFPQAVCNHKRLIIRICIASGAVGSATLRSF